MTGLDVDWIKENGQKKVMVVHFRPDKPPEDEAQWYEYLGNYAHTLAKLTKTNPTVGGGTPHGS